MRGAVVVALATVVLSGPLAAQENKPVPKDSARVTIRGCLKGYVFTAGPRAADEPGRYDIPEGLHIRMNGPKKMMADIKAHEGSMIELTGLMKKSQYGPDGIGLGGGVRISPGPGPGSGSFGPSPVGAEPMIDVEGWRPAVGSCPSR